MKNNFKTIQFIEKSQQIHGNKYDYSKTNYINTKTKITIICPEHGEFEQIPYSHLNKNGCLKCYNKRRSDKIRFNNDIFIQKAFKVHGNKYDYSKSEYKNIDTKVIIICPIHGEFEQIPYKHLQDQGCPKCRYIKSSISNTLTQKEFIQKAIKVHSNKYDYSKVNYIHSQTKITILCPEHGDFEQKPNSHLQGQGCPICKIYKIGKLKCYTQDQFIQKAQQVHGDKYDYSKVKYINSWTKVIIICPIHGEFEQTPNKHFISECKKCNFDKIGLDRRLTTEQFIEKSKKVHGEKYDYSKINYKNKDTKLNIICYNHGEFLQTSRNHLSGKGCPKCRSSKGEIAIWDILTKHNIEKERQYRIPEVANELYYDFYLPEYRLLIEFHGKQHYEYIPFFHDNDNRWDFEAQKDRDNYIRHNARSFKYNYLEFNYKQLKKLSKEQFERLVINNIRKFKKLN